MSASTRPARVAGRLLSLLLLAAVSGARQASRDATVRRHGNAIAAGPAVICQDDTASLGLRAFRSGSCPPGSKPVRVAAVNIFDQLWVGSTGMDTAPYSYPDARRALESAAAHGVRVFRFFGSLFGAATKMFVTNPSAYWAEYDRLVGDIERLHMYAIPSLGTGQWNEVANAVTPGLNETINDGVRNRSSVAYGLQARYFNEVVER